MKLLLIGQAATGKTTLSKILGKALNLPCHRIDDYRSWISDGSISGDYQARAAFLDACIHLDAGIFEFSAVGHHRAAVRQALREHGASVHVVCLWCNETERIARIKDRALSIPYPNWGVSFSSVATAQMQCLKDDADNQFWTKDDGWTRTDAHGDAPIEQVAQEILDHLGHTGETQTTEGLSTSVTWLAEKLGVPDLALEEWEATPKKFHDPSDLAWKLSAPDIDEKRITNLIKALKQEGWHTLIAPLNNQNTIISAWSKNLDRQVSIKIPWSCPISAESWAAAFVQRFERAFAYRAASNATAWFTWASSALDALGRCWWQAQGFASTSPNDERPPLRNKLPGPMRRHYRFVAPSLDLTKSTAEADRLFRLAEMFRDSIFSVAPQSIAASVLSSWLPRLRQLLNGRDALWNFRDVARMSNNHLHAGLLFRGSSPTRYYNDPQYAGKGLFERWLVESNIAEVIDLRRPKELEASPYPESWSQRIAYHHHPIGDAVEKFTKDPSDMAHKYLYFFEAYHDSIRASIRRVAESSGAVLIHCYAGMDRTGVVIAVIGYLCRVPRNALVHDYLASGGTTSARRIETLLDHLSNIGDAEAVAAHLAVEPSLLCILRARLSP